MEEERFKKFDLGKRQENAFEAAVENAKIANDAIKSSQSWLLLLGLAEISFLGTLLLTSEAISNCLLKSLVVLLLIAFILFILGSITQYKHILGIARRYEEISKRATDNYLNKDIRFVDKIPEDLELPKKQIVTSKVTNYLFFTSYILVILVTIGVIFLVLKI